MFTGIIENSGKVVNISNSSVSTQFTININSIWEDIKPGDSVSVNGVCLTIVEIKSTHLIADISPETLKRSTFHMYKTGTYVNLERAMKMSDRFGGHIVTGHIDGIASIKSKIEESNSVIFTFAVTQPLIKYIASKGSVAVDGISLTVADCSDNSFKVSIIPYTFKNTSLFIKNPGEYVNIECDILSKYVERLLYFNQEIKSPKLTPQFLKDTGFM